MEGMDAKGKIFHVPETVRLPFERFDFVVDTLDYTGSEVVIKVNQDSAPMRGYGAGKLFESPNPAGARFLEPVFKCEFRLGATRTRPRGS